MKVCQNTTAAGDRSLVTNAFEKLGFPPHNAPKPISITSGSQRIPLRAPFPFRMIVFASPRAVTENTARTVTLIQCTRVS